MIKNYLEVSFDGLKPVYACFMGSVMYVMFPEKSFLTACMAVLGAMCLDIVTKYHAIATANGGFINCIKTRKISSELFFYGTSRKLFAYLVISILTGLSYRVAPVKEASEFTATIVYLVLFLRECQSVLENLADAGNDVGLLLMLVKKKQSDVVDEYCKNKTKKR